MTIRPLLSLPARKLFSGRFARLDAITTLFTFSVSFVVYLLTLSPTIGLEDSGELAGAVVSWGVAHPSGYPLYVTLGKLFTLIIPFGELAWRANLFSAFCASCTVALFTRFLIAFLPSLSDARSGRVAHTAPLRADNPSHAPSISSIPGIAGTTPTTEPLTYFIALTVSLFFAFSPVFWSQSIITEVYTLNTLLFLLTLYLLWRYTHARVLSDLPWLGLVFGLSITNHSMLALLAPVYVFAIIASDWQHRVRALPWRRYLSALLLACVGVSWYWFIYFRAHFDPVINWGRAETLDRFWVHITRKTYSDVQLAFWEQIGQLKKLIYVHFFFRDAAAQMLYIGAPFSLVGFLICWFRRRAWLLATLGVLLSNSVLIILLRRLQYVYESESIYTVYYLPAFLILFLWLGIGIQAILQFLRRQSVRTFIFTGAVLLFCLFPLAAAYSQYSSLTRSDFWLAHDWATSLLQSLAPHAVLIVHNEQPAADSQIFSLAYAQLIEGARRDVAVVDFGYLSSRWYHPVGSDIEEVGKLPLRLQRALLLNRVWKEAEEVGRPVYTIWPVGSPLNGDLFGVPNGIAYQIFSNVAIARTQTIPPADLSFRNLQDERFAHQPFYLDFVSDIHYAQAAYLLTQGHTHASEARLIDAFNLDQTPFSINANDYILWRNRWLEGK